MSGGDARPLIVHVLFRFDTGGLEQVLLDTITGLSDSHRHAIVSLTTVSPAWRDVLPEEVEIQALGKREGHDPRIWLSMARLLRRLSPAVVHTYNLACLEFQAIAFVCRVPLRVHAEHGRNADDPTGANPRHRFLRRRLRSMVHVWIAVSRDLHDWLRDGIGIDVGRLALVYNGIDVDRFRPLPRSEQSCSARSLDGFCPEDALVVGTVGRLDPVKNQEMLIELWSALHEQDAFEGREVVLAIVGGGALEPRLRAAIERAGLTDRIWLPGTRSDVADLMPRFDVFVLPSIAEGLPMTLLEAMACARPVLVSRVGGMPELVTDGAGWLVAHDDEAGWKRALVAICTDPEARAHTGAAARSRVLARFDRVRMLDEYAALYAHGAAGLAARKTAIGT